MANPNKKHMPILTCSEDGDSYSQYVERPQGSFKFIQQTVTSTRKMDSDNSIVCKYRQNGATPSTSLPQSYSNTHSTTRMKSQDKTHAPKPGSQNILRRPIRDRLIHLLAVRPYKKPELFAVIYRDGVREKDKAHLTSILLSITRMRDNSYHLLRHVWNEVRDDWPFFTEEDRQMLKRRRPLNLTPSGTSDGSSSVGSENSPLSVHSISPPSTVQAPPSLKRHGYFVDTDGLPTKRQRIAHNRKSDEGFLWSESPVMKSSTVSQCSSLPRSGGLEVRPEKPLPSTPQLPDPKKAQTPPVPHPNPPNVALLYKFLVEYTPIMSDEQRQIYKEDFDRDFSEYQTLLPILENDSRKFAQLEQKLLKEEKDSEGYKKIVNQILHEYQESKKDVKQTEARKRFHYLHKKLAHIKWLVLDYDKAYLS